VTQEPPRLSRSAEKRSESVAEGARAWRGVEAAATFLGIPARTLRRAIDRQAHRNPDGSITATFDGLTARKFGRLWRVWLDAGWLAPTKKT